MPRSLPLAGASFLSSLILLFPAPGHCWVYPEHRDIAVQAIIDLGPSHRATLDLLWAAARRGNEARLCEVPADTAQGLDPGCIDYAAWTAIAGDHSCSAQDMVNSVLYSDWILGVAGVAAELKANLDGVTERYERVNFLRGSDIALQRVDPEYATRAGSNNVHFLLARDSITVAGSDYILSCLKEGAELNAIGAYSWYHLMAIYKASLWNLPGLTDEERSSIALAALADEAFGLHFLEDTFAAGHVAGTWGDASVRKGTHDYYNEHGLDAATWDKQEVVMLGDAYMRPEDERRAARTVRRSLEQLLDAVTGTGNGPLADPGYTSTLPENFNVCALLHMPKFREISERDQVVIRDLLTDVLKQTATPGLARGKGERPRFRSELGPFVGLTPATRSTGIGGGYGTNQHQVGYVPTIEAAVRFGYGIEGVMNESGDGLVFLDLGFRLDGPSTSSFLEYPPLDQYGSLTSAIPARSGITARIRLPFWLIPGDLLVLGPIMLFASPGTLANMAVQAGNGGLIPWQSGIATPIGRFQFILGREVGVSYYGLVDDAEARFFLPTENDILILGIRTLYFDFPVLEYRPFRTFSLTQSSSLILQLNAGFDVPIGIDFIESQILQTPSDQIAEPELRTVWHLGFRLVFDWRYYY